MRPLSQWYRTTVSNFCFQLKHLNKLDTFWLTQINNWKTTRPPQYDLIKRRHDLEAVKLKHDKIFNTSNRKASSIRQILYITQMNLPLSIVGAGHGSNEHDHAHQIVSLQSINIREKENQMTGKFLISKVLKYP